MNPKIVLLLTTFIIALNYEIIRTNSDLKSLIEANSHMLSLVFYEKYHSPIHDQSEQFREYEDKTRLWANIIIVDCQRNMRQAKSERFFKCDELSNSVDLFYLQGIRPNDYLINVRGKYFELTPRVTKYQAQKIFYIMMNFAQGLIPNFVRQIYNKKQYDDFMKGGNLLLPKVLLKKTSEQFDLIAKALAVHFYQRADFAQLAVQSQEFSQQNHLTLYKYNFNTRQHEKHQFETDTKSIVKERQNMIEFINSHAPPKRISRLYQLMTLPTNKIINTTRYQIASVMYNIELRTLVFEGNADEGIQLIKKYQSKYSDFFRYIILDSTQSSRLHYFSESKRHDLGLSEISIPEKEPITYEELRNVLDKNYLENAVLVVEEGYEYICSIKNLKLFSNFLDCYSVKEASELKLKYSIEEHIPLGLLYSKKEKEGYNIYNISQVTNYKNLIKQVYNIVGGNIKKLVNQFIQTPLVPIANSQVYSRACKSGCIIYLQDYSNTNKEQLTQMRQTAYKYNEMLTVRWGDYRCNQQLYDLTNKKGDNAVILYVDAKYYVLKEKITLSNIDLMMKTFRKGKLKLKQSSSELASSAKCNYSGEVSEEL